MNSFKDAIPACSAMFIYVLFDVITYTVIGAKIWLNTTMPIVVSCLIFMQFATGLWEELTFRALVLSRSKCHVYEKDFICGHKHGDIWYSTCR